MAYNSLQIAYFITVFVAAPLALIAGLGMSPALSTLEDKKDAVAHAAEHRERSEASG